MKHTGLPITARDAERYAQAAVTLAPEAKCYVWDCRGNGTGGGGTNVDR